MCDKYNVLVVLERLKKLVEDDKLGLYDLCLDLDNLLNIHACWGNSFGNYCENDPRGDMREGAWSLVSGKVQLEH